MLPRGYISHATAWWSREVIICTISTPAYRTLAMLTGKVGLVFWRQKRKYWRSVASTSSMPRSADANTMCPNCVEWVWPKICEIATLLGIQKRFLYLRIALWHNSSLRMHRWATSRHQRYVVTATMSAMAAFSLTCYNFGFQTSSLYYELPVSWASVIKLTMQGTTWRRKPGTKRIEKELYCILQLSTIAYIVSYLTLSHDDDGPL